YGRVSRYGMIAYGSSLDQGGPFARNAEDCALLLQTMSGFDRRDSTSAEQAVPDYSATLGQGVEGLKIGLPKEYFAEGLDGKIAAVIDTAIFELRKLGAEVLDISLPNTGLSIPTYYVIAMAECSSNLSRMDGVRFGHRCENPVDLEDLYKRSRGEGFGDEVKRRIMIGTYALSAGYYDAYYLKAQQLRRMIKNDFQQAFDSVDLILGPTTPETAFAIGAKTDDPVSMYLQDIYTISLNLAGLPGMSLPVGFSDGLPVGMQLIGNYFDETALLRTAHSYQQVSDWHLQAPAAFQ
ncbi:MAG: Asp-tRNA(Asn)/Glu-tRNA(Gln) amidotransferase subunit GatA, partial [Gammaproteobacteria bacterium]|nr:Asp-tRNA(Asn)/Glu-tRNA(Gln) amidotransferase subunit GatA [Gammaproteobacteria bacterium]